MSTASLFWFARHEGRLAWRDIGSRLRGGRHGGVIGTLVAMAGFAAVLHVVAYAILVHVGGALRHIDKPLLLSLTGSALMTWILLLSQSMDSVTRAFYTRDDLDLILSSPAPARRLFVARLLATVFSTFVMAAVFIGPAIDVTAILYGPRFLSAYVVLAAMSAAAVAFAAALIVVIFRVVGARRARLVAQIVAAIVGAGFVIWIQIAAVVSSGTLSRGLMFQSPAWIAAAPNLESPLWWPARGAMGDPMALAVVLGTALVLLAASIAMTAPALSDGAMRVAGLPSHRVKAAPRGSAFRSRSQARTLRVKEWRLLWRDPWLLSQSLMQILYLLPPAVLLWRDFGTSAQDSLVVLVPVLVMAAGQLAGGLAWLAISGEDAPDLVATAPLSAWTGLRAKVEAVAAAVALPIGPIAAAMAVVSPRLAIITIGGAFLAIAGSSAVQFFFRSPAKRSNFRRRQTSSRIATFAEAFFSISVAGAAGLAATGLWWFALVPAIVASGVLAASYAMAGRRD